VYLFRGIPPIKRLSLLSQEEMEKLVRLSEAEANNSLNWQNEAVASVWRYTQGHPFLTQQICFHVWEHIYHKAPENVPAVTPTDVENVIVDVLDVSRKTLEWLWDGLPPAGRVVASALAEAGTEPMTEQALETWFYENGISLIIPELQDMPHFLQEWDWLELTDAGYVFRVELLRRWLTENKPFRRIQNDLDCVDPVADSLFRAALDLYKKEQFDASIKQLREAIGLNPNHLGAQQLLADILLAQGKAGEAKQLLEKLYNYKPLAARSRLIQALLDLAQQSKRDAEKLEWYEQVLKLEPKQPEALAKRREIWRLRGDRALAKEDFKAALKFYKKLGISDQVAEIEQKIRERYFNFRDDFDSFKKKKRYQILALAILVLVSGIWAYWIQPLKGISPQQLEEAQAKTAQLEKALEQAQMEKAQFEKALEQAQVEKAQLEKEVKKAQAKQAHLEKALEQAKLAMIEIKKERATFFQMTKLGGFLSKLEKGDQVVIVASYQARHDADKMLEKLKAAYPELFYHQAALLPENIENNIYQRGKMWEIFISGFYSYTSAKALAKKLKTLDLIMDAFVRKNPFRDRRQLP
jgi:tetratricopeptide (TPR) repeat protein